MTSHLYRPINGHRINRWGDRIACYLHHSNGIDTFHAPNRSVIKLCTIQTWDTPDACGPIGSYLLVIELDGRRRWMEVSFESDWDGTAYDAEHQAGIAVNLKTQPEDIKSFIRNRIHPSPFYRERYPYRGH